MLHSMLHSERRNPVRIILAIVAFIAVFGGLTMLLWNWLVPAIFGGPEVTFVQALGLLALSNMLIMPRSRWHGGWRYREHWKSHLHEHMEGEQPEDDPSGPSVKGESGA